MWTRELLKRNAKEIFKRNYWTCVGVSLVLAALTGGGSSAIGRIGGNNTSVSYHHYGSDYYYGDSARGFMISMAVVAVTLIVVLAAVAFTIFAGNVFKIGGCSFFIKKSYHDRNIWKSIRWIQVRTLRKCCKDHVFL